MAYYTFVGFESQSSLIEQFNFVGATIDTSIVRTGAASARCNAASGTDARITLTDSSVPRGFVHFGLYVATLPVGLSRLIAGDGANGSSLKINPDGTISVFDGASSVGTSSTVLSVDQWYWIGWRTLAGTSTVVLQINGADEVSGTVANSGNRCELGFNDTVATAADAYFDDVIINDSGFIASSKVVLLVPISDNARAALWTGGAGGTTSLFDAVNNKPPVGTATETNTTQIEHAGGAAGTTDAYDANMTSYSTAGISATDTVLGIRYAIVHGEDSGTGTKLLNFSLVSNPAQATSLANFTAGNDAGALGTYPTGWTLTYNGLVSSPSVTVGTSPVMRVVRPETASRVASVCFMGMHVGYTPAAAAQVPYSRMYPSFLAQ